MLFNVDWLFLFLLAIINHYAQSYLVPAKQRILTSWCESVEIQQKYCNLPYQYHKDIKELRNLQILPKAYLSQRVGMERDSKFKIGLDSGSQEKIWVCCGSCVWYTCDDSTPCSIAAIAIFVNNIKPLFGGHIYCGFDKILTNYREWSVWARS